MHRIDRNCFLLIIDTSEYAGNFERELVAYMVGCVGEDDVGSAIAEAACAALESAGIELPDPISFTDDKGVSRPATIYPTPGWFNDGLGNEWPDDADPADVQAKYDEAVRSQADETRKVYGHMPEYGEERAQNILKKVGTEVRRWPAYLSVAVGFEDELDPSALEVMVQRAKDFCADPMKAGCRFVKNPIPFLGARYVRHEITVTLHPLKSWM